MSSIVLAVACFVLAVLAPILVGRFAPAAPPVVRPALRAVLVGIGLYLVFSTSYVNIGRDEVGLVTKEFGGSSLTGGRYIASEGEQGPQARILRPGFHPELMINVFNRIDHIPNVIVPNGYVGYLVARDGAPLRSDQAFADPLDSFKAKDGRPLAIGDMLDAATFLRNGGQKGPQSTVLPPGTWALNTFLWDVTIPSFDRAGKVTTEGMRQVEILSGFVGVVTSKVHARVAFGTLLAEKPKDCTAQWKGSEEAGNLAAALVPVGCIGVWDVALLPGRYLINSEAYQVDKFETRAQTWEYKGGYDRRKLDLEVAQDGTITSRPGVDRVEKPRDAADVAVFVKVEGWDIPQELRIVAQVPPEFAARVHTAVGELKLVEDKIVTPLVRSVVRNVMGGVILAPVVCEEEDRKDREGNVVQKASCVKGEPAKDANGRLIEKERPTHVLDLIENRPLLERNIEVILKREGLKAGVDIKEVRLGDPAIPPELLISRLREQLADQLSKAYRQEKLAQDQRVETEKARANAAQQGTLVQAMINVQAAAQKKQAAQLEGEGEEARLKAIASGQKDQATVLGEDRVVDLRKYELLLQQIAIVLDKHPEIITAALTNAGKFVPNTMVIGGEGGGMNGSIMALLTRFLSQDTAGGAAPPAVPPVPPRR